MENENSTPTQITRILIQFYEKEKQYDAARALLEPLCLRLSTEELTVLSQQLDNLSERNNLSAEIWAALLIDVFERCNRSDGRALMHNTLGRIYYERCEVAAAIRELNTSLALLADALLTLPDKDLVIQVVNGNLGRAYLSNREPQKAIQHLRSSLDLAERRKDDAGQAVYWHDLGVANHALQRLTTTLQCYLNSHKWAASVPDYCYKARLESNLAAAYTDLGEYHQALPHARKALDISIEQGNQPDAMRALSNLATLCYEMGDFREANANCRQAIALSQRLLLREDERRLNTLLGHIEECVAAAEPSEQQVMLFAPGLRLRKMTDFEIGEFLLPGLKITRRMEGSKGIVYKLVNLERISPREPGELCAKTLKSECFRTALGVRAFLEEAQHWLELGRYVTLASALSYEEDVRGKPYVLIEYADSGTLRGLLHSGFAPWSSFVDEFHALWIALGVSWALSYIHRRSSLAHGDISLDNIVLHGFAKNAKDAFWRQLAERMPEIATFNPIDLTDDQGFFCEPTAALLEGLGVKRGHCEFPKLTDFGIARTYTATSSTDLKADLRDFGARVLCALFTGQQPDFSGSCTAALQHPSVSHTVPQPIRDVIVACCENHYGSFEDVANGLQEAVRQRHGVDLLSPEKCFQMHAEETQAFVREAIGAALRQESPEGILPEADLVEEADLSDALKQHIRRFGARQIVATPSQQSVNLDLPSTIFNLAYGHYRLHEYSKAEHRYQEALSLCELRLAPDGRDCLKQNIFHNLGVLYQETRDYRRAAECFARERDLLGGDGEHSESI